MIELIKSKDDWTEIVDLIDHSDFYHTYYYHQLSKKEDEEPVLIKYTDAYNLIALPLLIRTIEGTPYFDATSVYGYAGPLLHSEQKTFDNSEFKRELMQFFEEQKIISVFSRLHPYIDYQECLLSGIGTTPHHNDVVNIDLTHPLDIQRQQYSSRLKTYINKARRECTIRNGTTEEDIKIFMDLYYENMNRVHANLSYFFDERYFYQLMLGCHFESEMLLVTHNETQTVVGGAIFIKTDEIVEYHLAGTKDEYLHLNPLKLLIDEMRIRATNENYKYFNLGGGKSSKHDSLFNFKASFSDNLRPFKLWKVIVNQEIYNELIELEKKKIDHEIVEDYSEYFPIYRYFSQIE
ncbi:peptidoglycan bridge formation glycyltransferase FemA/FemB family protein [Aurantibacter crassamenti]|uniref:peptidoglycan bridge formation glycyltransferase FemA/FemB family protein n=1 Tax=Aurantibacter crassamenti TaxID=1837375 RepID=UPI00193A5C71|nr:peptidoglycan bridge formation glycyltransferase FemA/FemB family protein [Aurantibacter crassamenti]MBM1106754.1 peptidoglycan bridge formation glycyltransferase FemA/FemB family protein [Aurantibacter crassamenti]